MENEILNNEINAEKSAKIVEHITNAKILIIDDDVNMMDILTVVLSKYGHIVKAFTEPVAAIEELKANSYDILLVNYLMTPVNGDRIIELVREFNKEIYIILMSMHRDLAPSIETMQTLDIQAYFEKSSRFDQLIMFIQSGIKYTEQLKKIRNMDMKLEQYLADFAKILLNTVEAKDHYTEEHSRRVSALAVLFGKFLNLQETQINNLRTAGLFHDIGKIGIPDSILQKEDILTDEEYETIKLHPVIGANILSLSSIYKDVAPIIYYHHEKYNGKGYPDKLKGDKIPYNARILSLCDCFEAIYSKRPYKEKTDTNYALDQIKIGKGTQFDAQIADKFIEFINKNREQIHTIMNSHEGVFTV
ncbi:MAG: HD domain-containing protein [Clostridia bacterium]